MELLQSLAHGAIALLVAALGVYFSLRLLGKMAKFVIALILVGVVAWFVFSNPELMRSLGISLRAVRTPIF